MPTWHPVGYSLLLRVLSVTGSLATVPVVQHLMGLATGVLIYRFLRRRGASDPWAAAAAAPILLDAWSVSVEHGIVTEPLFDLLLVVALTFVTRSHLSARTAAAGCLLLGLTMWVRTTGLVVGVVAVGYVLLRQPGRRAALAAAGAFLLPVVAYFAAFHAANGSWGPDEFSGRYLYAETATFANCAGLPAADRRYCPALPVAHRGSPTSYGWGTGSPIARVHPATEVRLNAVGRRFALDTIQAQPLDYLGFVARTTLHYFAPGRGTGLRDYPAQTWQFPPTSNPPPIWSLAVAAESFDGATVTPVTVHGLAKVLRGYQRLGFTPGPVLAVAVLVGLAGIWRVRHDRRAALDLGLLLGLGVGLLVLDSALSGAAFDYRYLVTSLTLIPPAGALGAAYLFRSETRPNGVLALRAVVAATVALGIASNAATFGGNVTPASRQQPAGISAIGTAQSLPGGVTVTASRPRLWYTTCGQVAANLRPGLLWVVLVQVSATTRHGARLIRPDSFTTSPAPAFWAAGRSSLESPGWLPDAVIDPSYPAIAGRIALRLNGEPHTLTYTDATGNGTAAWHLAFRVRPDTPAPGTPCVLPKKAKS